MVRTAPVRFADRRTALSRDRVAALVGVIALHGLIALVLVRALADRSPGGLDDRALRRQTTAIVIVPPPPPSIVHGKARVMAKAPAAPAGATAMTPAPMSAAITPAPMIANAVAPVATAAGSGAGAGTASSGTGDGGTGGGARAEKIAGDLTERDYPKAGRARRLGTAVIVALTVGSDGRVSACRVQQPSGDPDADAITCRLAIERFRFRPARNAAGAAVEAVYGWQQRFFAP